MEIKTIDSKNLIITTDFGSRIEIKNNQTIVFGNNEISLKKIKSVGDVNVGITSENSDSEIIRFTKHKKNSGILSIIFFVIFIPTFISYQNSARVARQMGLGKQDNSIVWIIFILFIIVFGYYLFIGSRITSIKNLDFTKNNHPLPITFEFIDGKKKETKSYVVGYASMEELKELKEIILSKKVDSLLT
jgi:hypothetical protein